MIHALKFAGGIILLIIVCVCFNRRLVTFEQQRRAPFVEISIWGCSIIGMLVWIIWCMAHFPDSYLSTQ